MERVLGWFALGALVFVGGCGMAGGVMKSYSMKKAREVHAVSNRPCDEKVVQSVVLKELPRPKMVDYLALIAVTGCGKEKRYVCGNYLCSDARKQELNLPNYCNEYKCEDAP